MDQNHIPVPITLCSFLDDVYRCKIKHFFQRGIIGKGAFRLGDFPELPVQPFNDICGVQDPSDIVAGFYKEHK